MSDFIKHECGIALLKLKKPLEYYQKKYGSALFGINKMYLMMSNKTQHASRLKKHIIGNSKCDVVFVLLFYRYHVQV